MSNTGKSSSYFCSAFVTACHLPIRCDTAFDVRIDPTHLTGLKVDSTSCLSMGD